MTENIDLYEIEQLIDAFGTAHATVELMKNDERVHPESPSYDGALKNWSDARAALMSAINRLARNAVR